MRRAFAILLAALSFAPLAPAAPERDLRAFCENPKNCEPIELNGIWGIDKGHVLSVDAIRQLAAPKETKVPGTWSPSPINPFSPVWNEAQDLGTYWLVLKNLTPEQGLGLHMPNVHGAYRVYWQPLNESVNRPVLFAYGWNDENPRQSEANLRDHFINLPMKTAMSDYLLVIQVANQSLAKAGLRTAPRLGRLTDLQTDQFEHMLLYCLVIGATFIIGFYHFLIYLQRRSDHSALWLAVECLMIISHTVAMQRLYQYVIPEPSNILLRVVTMLLYTPHIVAPIAFYAFLAFHFPRVRHRAAPYIFGIPAILLGLSFLTPLSFFARFYLIGFMPVMTAFILFIFARSAVAFRGDRDFQTIFAGIVILGLASIHDALAESKASSSLVPFAEIIFIMMQGWLLSKRFAQAYNTASRLSRDLEKEVQRQTRDIRSILDTIEQGIVTVQDENMNLGPEHSRTMGDWFMSALNGHNFELVLDQSPSLSNDRRDQIKEVLKASIGEDPMNFEINLALLPKELLMNVHGQERHFELDWTPIVDNHGIIEKVLVCLRDVSEVRALRDQSRQNEEELRIIQELLNIPEDRFKSFVKKMHQYLAESQVLVGTLERKDSMNRLEAIRQIFMNIHTIKGTARTLHLQAIASASHDLEKEISHLRQKPDQQPVLHPLRDKFELVQSVINRYQAVSHEKLGWDMDEDNVRLPKRLVLECAHILAELPDPSRHIIQLEESLLKHCPSDLGHAVLEASRGIDSIARDLNKTPPKIDIDAQNIMLTDPGSHLIQALFTHLIRNSLDHGLEDKAERATLGKPEQGTVRISAHIQDTMLIVRCQDDGRGLNLRKIRETGERLGFITPAETLPPQATAELIFRSGLSTKEAVTEISGRGVGMDAVRSFVERVGGRVDISLQQPFSSELKVPFALVLQLPQEFWWYKDARRGLTRSA